MIFNLYLSFFIFFWFLHILRRTFFWLYLWQLKEYRWDRFKDELQQNPRVLVPVSAIAALALLLFSPLLFKVTIFDKNLFEMLVFAFCLIFGLYSLYLLFNGKWSLPRFTKKMIALSVFTICLAVVLFMIINPVWYLMSEGINPFLAVFVLTFEILLPFFVCICVGVVQLPTFFAKRKIIKKAKEKREQFKDLIVIGVTGSYGKTSTKEMLFQMLSLKYKVLKTEGNNNTEMGVAQTVLQKLKKNHQVFVCEMAAYKKGEIKAICDIVHPKIGILTGISHQHISLFGSFKNIIQTKYELINSLPEDGLAIFNGANKECQKLAQRTTIRKIVYSPEALVEEVEETADFIEFKLKDYPNIGKIRLNLLGRQNLENFLGALICALELKVPLKKIQELAPKLKPSVTAMRKTKGKNGVTIIDNSYSQNPDGVIAAIEYLKNFKGKKVVIMPCLIELGKSAPSVHKNIGRKIGEVVDLAIITTSYYFEELKLGAQEAGMKQSQIIFSKKPKKILEKLNPYFKKENVFLIEGRVSADIYRYLLPATIFASQNLGGSRN